MAHYDEFYEARYERDKKAAADIHAQLMNTGKYVEVPVAATHALVSILHTRTVYENDLKVLRDFLAQK